MCRYMLSQLNSHWVCLSCRASFKRRAFAEIPRCPLCRAPTIDLGHDFQPPRKTSDNQWRKIELLVSQGIRFHSCGCTGPGWRPRTLGEAKRQLLPDPPYRNPPYRTWSGKGRMKHVAGRTYRG